METVNPRTVALEEKVSHLERHLSELDGVVRDLHDRMDRSARQLVRLKGLVESVQRGEGGEGDEAGGHADAGPSDADLEDDRPPHW